MAGMLRPNLGGTRGTAALLRAGLCNQINQLAAVAALSRASNAAVGV